MMKTRHIIKKEKKRKMPNGHGGKRENTGRKKWNHASKLDNNQSRLGNFFETQNNSTSTTAAATSSSTTQTQSNSSSARRSTHTDASTQRASSSTTSRPSSTSRSTSSSRPSSTSRSSSTHRRSQTTNDDTQRTSSQRASNAESENNDNNSNNSRSKKRGKKVSGSSNLQWQIKAIKETSYFDKAYANAKKGILWDHPPTITNTTTFDLKECWKDFFKLPIFNWIPEAMIPDFKPICPCCKNKLTKWGKKNPPRLVFGAHQNYFLNSPQNYFCTTCNEYSKGKPKKERRKGLYKSHSEAILKQIGAIKPELLEIFPCHLQRKNAIDKKLMTMVVHCSVKGIGPVAMCDMISSWHELEYQKKENQWAAHVHEKVTDQPTVTQTRINNREEIQKCPDYFSKEMGGCVPSGSWLVKMFCLVITEFRHYYDSECIKRAKSSKVIAVDASYKIPKWMMKWGGKQKLYEALHSGTNEYNEIIMQRFSTSDNHEELGSNLRTLKQMGVNPYLAFSDDPTRDENLLKETFPNLRNAADDGEETVEVPPELTEYKTEKKLLYLYEIDKVCLILSQFRQDIEDAINNQAHNAVKVSFDCEWPVYMETVNNRTKKTKGNVNILQLASNVTDYTLVIELYSFADNHTHLNRIGQKLRALFSLQVSCFTGCRQKGDYTLLQKQYPMFELPDSARSLMEDVALMAINRGVTKRGKGTTTLQAICETQKIFLRKPAHVRVGDVFGSKNGTLSKEGQIYCQLDVEAPLQLHGILNAFPDLTRRMANENATVGTRVDIMPACSTATEPIAQGVIKQRGGTLWATNKMKIRKDRVLVEIKKVFNSKGTIHYPCDDTHIDKCSCGQSSHGTIDRTCDFYLLSQMGQPPFNLLEMKSRLRPFNEQIEYPKCIYEGQATESEEPSTVNNYIHGGRDPSNDTESDSEDEDGGEDTAPQEDDEETAHALTLDPEVVQFLKSADVEDDESVVGVEGDEPELKELRTATSLEFNKILDEMIQQADALAEKENIEKQSEKEEDLPLDEISRMSLHKTVLADIFHLMDRAKLPMHHEYKALFFRALRSAMFILNKDDVDQVKAVMEKKDGVTWEKTMAFNWEYIALRVRRRAPPAHIMYHRMLVVFNFFKDKVDSESGKVLFNKDAKKKFVAVLELVKRGYASDPPNLAMYVEKTDDEGRKMVDKDGLTLYRSIRGTSNLESLHQYLTTSFGHTTSGPWYSDCLLTIIRHMYNWRMSIKNRPGFPKIRHYNGLLLDRINHLYEQIYGYTKHKNWSEFNENLPTESAYGIVPIQKELTSSLTYSNEDVEVLSENDMLSYLAQRQEAPFPFLPIRSVNEKKLAHKMLNEVVVNNESLSSQHVYEKIAKKWNTHHISISDKIYPKLPSHFIKYVKGWMKNQSRRDAELGSGADKLNKALEYVPESTNFSTLEPVEISETVDSPATPTDPTVTEPANSNLGTASTETANPGTTQPMMMLCQVCDEAAAKKKRKRTRTRTCQGTYNKKTKTGQHCPNPTTCVGKNGRANCVLRTGGDESKKTKRTILNRKEAHCFVCGRVKCPGIIQRKECNGIPLIRDNT